MATRSGPVRSHAQKAYLSALERAFASGKPACVNVMTDPNVIAPTTRAMVGAPPAKPAAETGAGGTVQIPYYDDLES